MLSTPLVPEYQFSCATIPKNSIIARQIFSNYTALLFRQVTLWQKIAKYLDSSF